MEKITQLFDHGKQLFVYYYIFFRSQIKSTIFMFQNSIFPKGFTKDPSKTKEKQVKYVWEVCLSWSPSRKWLLYICTLKSLRGPAVTLKNPAFSHVHLILQPFFLYNTYQHPTKWLFCGAYFGKDSSRKGIQWKGLITETLESPWFEYQRHHLLVVKLQATSLRHLSLNYPR